MRLADHYRDNRELGKAQDLLNQAVEVSGNNPDIKEQLEDIQLMMLRKDLGKPKNERIRIPAKSDWWKRLKVWPMTADSRNRNLFPTDRTSS